MNPKPDDDGVPFEVNVPSPDSSQANQVGSFMEEAKSPSKIRLGCVHCDRTDFDGIDELPNDWHEIHPFQTWEASIQPVEKSVPGQASCLAWEIHLGICPDCYEAYDRVESPVRSKLDWQESEVDSDEEGPPRPEVHPIVRQIINRDCHVGESKRTVVRHVISKLRGGYTSYRTLSKVDRRKFIEQCIEQHRYNNQEYVEVMSGFRYTTVGKKGAGHEISFLPGAEIAKLMRRYEMTIDQLAFRLGSSQKRVRLARDKGLTDPYAIRDWIQAISGCDVGPIPEKYRIRSISEEGSCQFCGCPLYRGETAYDYGDSMFCSITCARKSRGW